MIRLENVWKIYPMDEIEVVALKNITLRIPRGKFVVILGPSGSGKSTLLHIASLLDVPSKGKVYFEEKEVSRFSEDELADIRNRKIGFVFQQFNLLPYVDALSNVELPLVFQKIPKKERAKIARAALVSVGLEKRMKHRPPQLSGGERQRVSIARAIAGNPEVIFADEPTGNIDSKTGEQILKIISDLNKKEKKTVVVITHDESATRFADTIIKIKDGELK